MAKENDTLYDEVVSLTYRYLGPAADRFVYRQCESHLNKKPSQLCKNDLSGLIIWFILAMAALSEDREVVERFGSELEALTR